MNADDYVLGGEKTEKVLKRMEREGYIVKVIDRDGGGEESIEYVVGPRGKAEVGEIGVAGMVRKVYGKRDIEAEELERRLVRSLGEVVIDKKRRRGEREGEGEREGQEDDGRANRINGNDNNGNVDRGSSRRLPTRSRRSRNEVEAEAEAEDEDEESEDQDQDPDPDQDDEDEDDEEDEE